MLAAQNIGRRDVARVLESRRDFIRQELRRVEDTLAFYQPAEPKGAPPVSPKLPGPSGAILRAVTAHPGASLKEIINSALSNGFRTKSKDPKHALRNTVDVLLKAGRIKRLDGKLYPASG